MGVSISNTRIKEVVSSRFFGGRVVHFLCIFVFEEATGFWVEEEEEEGEEEGEEEEEFGVRFEVIFSA